MGDNSIKHLSMKAKSLLADVKYFPILASSKSMRDMAKELNLETKTISAYRQALLAVGAIDEKPKFGYSPEKTKDLDAKIMGALPGSYKKLAERANLPLRAVKQRIRRLEKKEQVAAYGTYSPRCRSSVYRSGDLFDGLADNTNDRVIIIEPKNEEHIKYLSNLIIEHLPTKEALTKDRYLKCALTRIIKNAHWPLAVELAVRDYINSASQYKPTRTPSP
jgi:hypothetical protein